LVYEGDYEHPHSIERNRIDIRLIDFDHAIIKKEKSNSDIAGVQTGIQSLIKILEQIHYKSLRNIHSFMSFPTSEASKKDMKDPLSLERSDSDPITPKSNKNKIKKTETSDQQLNKE
jgi:hypothetical protein